MASGGGTLLGFDYGRRRIGVAVGNTLTRRARPLLTLAATDAGPDWTRIAALLAEWQPARLVVGVPYNDAAPGAEIAAEAQRFARRLHGRFLLPVDTLDEQLSSAAAHDTLKAARRAGRRGTIGKEDIDSAAAAVILQDWFDNHS
ncbi:Holliday junction resolvase RuvX [Wenzhouxiangella sp. XN24]|uniref:Holliday junction resolvase RuvX n=1 Tax=Wenzhouxiangella sp. XN24 TaxID=2713569 RepID=UPI0013ECE99F|nr:Holliday junction resolvase RuvX [Wenzhouxiangella sp. XN24]NGX16068.1 Holliday junction resolvase RuvX [Wenzhouxiangella sp. XN24]